MEESEEKGGKTIDTLFSVYLINSKGFLEVREESGFPVLFSESGGDLAGGLVSSKLFREPREDEEREDSVSSCP